MGRSRFPPVGRTHLAGPDKERPAGSTVSGRGPRPWRSEGPPASCQRALGPRFARAPVLRVPDPGAEEPRRVTGGARVRGAGGGRGRAPEAAGQAGSRSAWTSLVHRRRPCLEWSGPRVLRARPPSDWAHCYCRRRCQCARVLCSRGAPRVDRSPCSLACRPVMDSGGSAPSPRPSSRRGGYHRGGHGGQPESRAGEGRVDG